MSDYKRLTKKEGIGRFVNHDCITCSQHKDDRTGCDFCGGSEYSNNWCCGVLYNRLADLEDKIENGTLVELPCKIGDTVYYIDSFWKPPRLKEYEVYGFFISKSGVYIEVGFGMCITKNEIFLTKAEAEAELAKIRGQK